MTSESREKGQHYDHHLQRYGLHLEHERCISIVKVRCEVRYGILPWYLASLLGSHSAPGEVFMLLSCLHLVAVKKGIKRQGAA